MRRRLVVVNSQLVDEIGPAVFSGGAAIAPRELRDRLLAGMMEQPDGGAPLLTGQCEEAMLLVSTRASATVFALQQGLFS